MTKFLLAILLLLMCAQTNASCVILLHGLARTHDSMDKLADALSQENYQVVNLGYPSRDYAIEELAQRAIEPPCSNVLRIMTYILLLTLWVEY